MCKYPCENCKRVSDPGKCEDKRCKDWKKWFLKKWDMIHYYYLQEKHKEGN